MRHLRAREICQQSRVSRADGRLLRTAIEAAWTSEPVEVDFENETIASISFLDEGIASLFADHDVERIRAHLILIGLTEPDRRELNLLVAKRRAKRTAA